MGKPTFSFTVLVDIRAPDIQSALSTLLRRLDRVGVKVHSVLDAENMDTGEEYDEGQLLEMMV